MIAKGNKVQLRYMEFDDIPFLITVRNESRTSLHDVRKFGLADAVKWWGETKPQYFMIELLDGTPVGYFRTSDWDISWGGARRIMIGADIHPDHRRKGYAFEAYEMFLSWMFKSWEMNKVSLEVLSDNKGAIALYEKLGFVREGVKREEVLRAGKYLDSIIMSILNSEFKANQSILSRLKDWLI